MNRRQYKNIIKGSLKQCESKNITTHLEQLKVIMKNLGVAFPQGDRAGIIDSFSSNDYMGWKKCSPMEAVEFVNNGTIAIGISDTDSVMLLSNMDEINDVDTTTLMVMDENTTVAVINNMSLFAFSPSTTTTTTTTKPTTTTTTTNNPSINPPVITETYCSNTYLNEQQKTVNAQYILNYLRNYGWSKEAICAMLGNMERESTINPGIWQSRDEGNMNRGYGLVQWTPATKYIDWAIENDLEYNCMDSQLQRILYEVEQPNYFGRNYYLMTFKEFSTSTEDVAVLTEVFVRNYERPKNLNLEDRVAFAEKWYTTLI